MFDKLVLVVGHSAMEHDYNVNVTTTGCPEAIHTRPSGRDGDLTLKQVRLCPAITMVECVLNTLDYLITRFQIFDTGALFFIDASRDFLSSFQSCGSGL